MKNKAIAMALLSAGLLSQAVSAKSTSVLEWRGFVGGAFPGSDIGLTGQGGGDIQLGQLSVDGDGAFTSSRAIIVEAHGIDNTSGTPTIKPELFDGDVDWSIAATNISHAAYDVTRVKVFMNGDEITEGSTIKTEAGNHIVGFSVSSPAPDDASLLTPGDAISVTTMVFAEASPGTPPTPPL